MTNAEEKKERRAKGKGFPSIGLEDAFGLIKQGFSGGFDMSIETFAAAIDSSPKSGPFLSKIAALRDFGLVERGSRIKYTSLARGLVSPTSEEPGDHLKNLQTAFFNCDVFKTIYERIRTTSRESSLKTLANVAMNDFRVAPHRGTEFAKNFLNSGKFAGLLDGDAARIQIIDSAQDLKPEEIIKTTEGGSVKTKKGGYEFEFKDAGPGWELFIATDRSLDTKSRKKILELIELFEEGRGGNI